MSRELPIFTPPVTGHHGHDGHGTGAGLSTAIDGAPGPVGAGFEATGLASRRHPDWLKAKIGAGDEYQDLRRLVRGLNLNTVCEEARCPNIGECWDQRTATIMILGDTCTRACGFCAVKTGRPTWFDADEPRRVAEAVSAMGLEHVVVTSVARDDLPDGGASVFAETIRRLRDRCPGMGVEVLIPDFNGLEAPLRTVMEAGPDILNHNLETVERLQAPVRKRARYDRSLGVLERAKAYAAGNLKSTQQQVVKTEASGSQTIYIIEPAQPTVVYVPTYNPYTIYGTWWYPAPPYYMYPPAYVYPPGVAFATGVVVGAAIWGGTNWHGNSVTVNVNQYNSYNKTSITSSTYNSVNKTTVNQAQVNSVQGQAQAQGVTKSSVQSQAQAQGMSKSSVQSQAQAQGVSQSSMQGQAQAAKGAGAGAGSTSTMSASSFQSGGGFSGAGTGAGAATREASARGGASRASASGGGGGGGRHR